MPELKDLIEEELERFNVPGVAVAVVHDGEIVLSKGFGYRDAERALPVTDHTLFAIGSCTKAFTSTLVASLVDEGLLEWDRPVREYLPGFELTDPNASRALTLRDMLSHRTGLARNDMMLLMHGHGELSRAELVDRLRFLPFNKSFRDGFQYNNLLYMTVGFIIEVVTGDTWEEAVQHRILDPLGMDDTNFSIVDLQKADDHSLPYSKIDGAVVEVPFRGIEMIGPAGSINSCVADMTSWLLANLDGSRTAKHRIVSEDGLKQVRTPAVVIPDELSPWPEKATTAYALGWRLENHRGHNVLSHTGGIDGFSAIVTLVPSESLGIVALSNLNACSAVLAIPDRIIDETLGLDPLPWGERHHELDHSLDAGGDDAREFNTARSKGTPPTHPLDDFAGSYTHPAYGRISFAVDDGELVADLHDLSVTLHHRHYNVWDAHETTHDEWIPMMFVMDLHGEIAAVEIRFDVTVAPFVFAKDPPTFSREQLEMLAGRYSSGPMTLDVEVVGTRLAASSSLLGAMQLLPSRGLRFQTKEHAGITVEFITGDDGVAEQAVLEDIGIFERVREG